MTAALLRRHGVHGTGIAEVLARSGTARQSIYQHFPGGKAELVVAATRRAGEFIVDLSDDDDPHAHVDARIDWWIGQLERHDYALGCPIAAAALAGPDSPTIVAAASEVFDDWTERFASLLIAAGADPEAATSLARFQLSAMEGAIMLARARRSTTPLDDVRVHVHLLIDGVLSH